MVSGCAARASGGRPRTELDAALEIFEKYGAGAWAERARGELPGQRSCAGSRPQAGLELNRSRIAGCASCGLGSPIGEIVRQLFHVLSCYDDLLATRANVHTVLGARAVEGSGLVGALFTDRHVLVA